MWGGKWRENCKTRDRAIWIFVEHLQHWPRVRGSWAERRRNPLSLVTSWCAGWESGIPVWFGAWFAFQEGDGTFTEKEAHSFRCGVWDVCGLQDNILLVVEHSELEFENEEVSDIAIWEIVLIQMIFISSDWSEKECRGKSVKTKCGMI